MAKRPVSQLLDEAQETRAGKRTRLSPEVRSDIEADLKAIEAAREEGRPVPSYPRIAKYLHDEYGLRIGASTVGNWLFRIRTGGSL